MRSVHAGHAGFGNGTTRDKPFAFRSRSNGCDWRRAMPLHRVPANYRRYPRLAEQPVFAHEGDGSRSRVEAIAAIVVETNAIENLDPSTFPVSWQELPALRTIDNALAPGALLIRPHRAENVLTRGRVVRGDVEKALAGADALVEAQFETGFVAHAFIEPA